MNSTPEKDKHSHAGVGADNNTLPPPTLPEPKNCRTLQQSEHTERTIDSFRLPELADIKNSSVLNKYKKNRKDDNKIIPDNDNENNAIENQLIKQPRGNSTESNSATFIIGTQYNNSNSPLNTTKASGKHNRSFREKLGERSDSFRRSLTRISGSVVARTQEKTAKCPLQEKQSLLDEDPDESINRFLKENENETYGAVTDKEKPKKKRGGLSSQSVRITNVDKTPVSPTYRKLDASPGTVRSRPRATIETTKKEEPTETYRKISLEDSRKDLLELCKTKNTKHGVNQNNNTTELQPSIKYDEQTFKQLNTEEVLIQSKSNTDDYVSFNGHELTKNDPGSVQYPSNKSMHEQQQVRRCYSNPLRRELYPQNKTLEKISSPKNILFFSGRVKQNHGDHPVTSQTEIPKTSLYEENFKRSNSRKTSQESWLGRSGLLDLENKGEMSTAKGGMQKNLNTSKENLLEHDDSDDEDNALNRRIEANHHNTQLAVLQRKDSKRRMIGLGRLSLKKKYNFGKL